MDHVSCERVMSNGHIIHKCQFFDGFSIFVDSVEVVRVRGLNLRDRLMRTRR